MISSHRGLRVPELGVVAVDHTVFLPTVRVVVSVRRGVQVDDRLFASAFPLRLDSTRWSLIIPLEGRVGLRRLGRPDVTLCAGDVLLERRDAGWGLRQEGHCATLIAELCATTVGAARAEGPWPLGAKKLEALRRALTPLVAAASDREIRVGLLEASALLRAHGLSIDPFPREELDGEDPPGLHAIVAAADAAVNALGRGPGSPDLEDALGWSARHVHRRLRLLHARYGFNAAGGARDLFHRWRLYGATMIATAPDATTEKVAALTGYAAAPALCRALAQRGLPSPGSAREAFAAIG